MKKILLGISFILTALVITSNSSIITSLVQKDGLSPLPKLNKKFLIVAHVVKNQQGVPGITQAQIEATINASNAYFAPIGVSFELCELNFIDEFRYDVCNRDPNTDKDYDLDELLAKYAVSRRINLFYTSEIEHDFPVCGKASLGGIKQDDFVAIWLEKSCNTPSTFVHEMGHYFGLSHTFEGSGTENADGSNCETAGDKICDTPADNYDESQPLSNYVVNCQYINTEKDANGDYYDPDVSNVMSYYNCDCGFTDGQYRKMVENYLNNPVKW